MDDLVTRLRAQAELERTRPMWDMENARLFDEAADELERLRISVAELSRLGRVA
jgi:hypothetical protein